VSCEYSQLASQLDWVVGSRQVDVGEERGGEIRFPERVRAVPTCQVPSLEELR